MRAWGRKLNFKSSTGMDNKREVLSNRDSPPMNTTIEISIQQ